MHPFLNTAFKAARKAGQLMCQNLNRLDQLDTQEKSKHNWVSEIDLRAEKILIETLKEAYPDHAFQAEESGFTPPTKADEPKHTWLIDPLDGTSNYLRGFPHFAISCAVMTNNAISHGLIYDPLRDELFHATRGEGAFLNRQRIRVSDKPHLAQAVIATGLPERTSEQLAQHTKIIQALSSEITSLRCTGSATLDLAYVACGRFDGFWEFSLQPWDVAAGGLLVHEAGGFVGNAQGGPEFLNQKECVAGNPKIFKQLIQTLKRL